MLETKADVGAEVDASTILSQEPPLHARYHRLGQEPPLYERYHGLGWRSGMAVSLLVRTSVGQYRVGAGPSYRKELMTFLGFCFILEFVFLFAQSVLELFKREKKIQSFFFFFFP